MNWQVNQTSGTWNLISIFLPWKYTSLYSRNSINLKISKIEKFVREMLENMENAALQIWYIFYLRTGRCLYHWISTPGLPARMFFLAWSSRYQLKDTKAGEFWQYENGLEVTASSNIQKYILYVTTQVSSSWANTLIFRPSLITLFEAKQAVQMYLCQWFALRVGRNAMDFLRPA